MHESEYPATCLALRTCDSGDQLSQVSERGERAAGELAAKVRKPKCDEDDDENNQPFELDQ